MSVISLNCSTIGWCFRINGLQNSHGKFGKTLGPYKKGSPNFVKWEQSSENPKIWWSHWIFEFKTHSNLVVIDEKCFYCRKIQPSNKIGSWICPGGDVRRQTVRRSSMEKKFLAIIAVSSKGKHFIEVYQEMRALMPTGIFNFLSTWKTIFQPYKSILTHNMSL